MQRIAKFIEYKTVDAANMVQDAAEQATNIAVDFGALEICHLVPKVPMGEPEQEPEKEEDKPIQVLTSDPNLQLKILRDLANATVESMNMNTIFQTVLERMVLVFFNKIKSRKNMF